MFYMLRTLQMHFKLYIFFYIQVCHTNRHPKPQPVNPVPIFVRLIVSWFAQTQDELANYSIINSTQAEWKKLAQKFSHRSNKYLMD